MVSLLSLFLFVISVNAVCKAPSKIYGVNLGNWLVFEPWMAEKEWKSMGGEQCGDCSSCIRSEWALTKAYPSKADELFAKHWDSWFTQTDVDKLVDAGINTVRIPLGFWIVEALVNTKTEFYPKGGLTHLKRGLKMLKAAGIKAILDHHALPGVAAVNQMFAGQCTKDVQFYSTVNYQRALTWTAVMTAMTHLDPDFGTVFAIEATNEPVTDASKTPGFGKFQKNFVQTIRGIELAIGIPAPGHKAAIMKTSSIHTNLSATIPTVAGNFTDETAQALHDAVGILADLANQYNISSLKTFKASSRKPITTNFMDINWQFNNPPNPADAAIGPQGYDNHLYYGFGGVASPNEQAYLQHACTLNRVQADARKGNTQLWFGEWSLLTQFDASDEFMKKWADAQKLSYSKGAGWIFWNFKVEDEGGMGRQWSYFEGLKRGYLTKDPAKLNDPHVCDQFN